MKLYETEGHLKKGHANNKIYLSEIRRSLNQLNPLEPMATLAAASNNAIPTRVQ